MCFRSHAVQFEAPPCVINATRQMICNTKPARVNGSPMKNPGIARKRQQQETIDTLPRGTRHPAGV